MLQIVATLTFPYCFFFFVCVLCPLSSVMSYHVIIDSIFVVLFGIDLRKAPLAYVNSTTL